MAGLVAGALLPSLWGLAHHLLPHAPSLRAVASELVALCPWLCDVMGVDAPPLRAALWHALQPLCLPACTGPQEAAAASALAALCHSEGVCTAVGVLVHCGGVARASPLASVAPLPLLASRLYALCTALCVPTACVCEPGACVCDVRLTAEVDAALARACWEAATPLRRAVIACLHTAVRTHTAAEPQREGCSRCAALLAQFNGEEAAVWEAEEALATFP